MVAALANRLRLSNSFRLLGPGSCSGTREQCGSGVKLRPGIAIGRIEIAQLRRRRNHCGRFDRTAEGCDGFSPSNSFKKPGFRASCSNVFHRSELIEVKPEHSGNLVRKGSCTQWEYSALDTDCRPAMSAAGSCTQWKKTALRSV